MKNLTTILFDAGGTLVGADNIFQVLIPEFRNSNITAQVLGAEFAKEKEKAGSKFADVKGLLKNICKNISEQYSVEDIGLRACELYKHTYTETVYLYDDVIETLTALQNKNIRLILVSDADSDVLTPQFSKLGLDPYFNDRIISSDIKSYKPSDETASFIKSLLKETDTNLLFVGDSPEDIEIAKKIGAESIFIGKPSPQASHTISQFCELLPLIYENYWLDRQH